MMDQLYEKKCDCQQYDDMGDHRSALIKMELPNYEDGQYGGTSYTIFRALRFIGYIIVLVLLSYSLWRIHVIESTLLANERFNNISKIIALENNYGHHRRVARFVDVSSLNSFVDGGKPLLRDSLLNLEKENPLPSMQKPKSKEDFQQLVNNLFDKIQTMHDDQDRDNFDNNIKAVFKAWFPVFDALLPREMREDGQFRLKRQINKIDKEHSKEMKSALSRKVSKSNEESSEERLNPKKSKGKSSEESSEEKHSRPTRSVNGSNKDSSASSSEEKIIENVLYTRKPTKKNSKKIQDIQNNSDESSEEIKPKNKRSLDKNSGESVESSEENMKKLVNHEDKSSEESSEEKNKNVKSEEKNSSESVEYSESKKSPEKNNKNIKDNYLTYEVIVPE